MNQLMQQASDPMDLRSLPLIDPPSDDWPVIEAALKQRQNRKRHWKQAAAVLAVAATVTLVVGLSLYQAPSTPSAPASVEVASLAAEEQAGEGDTGRVTVESLIGLSQQLEKNLRLIRAEVGVMPTDSLIYQVELEDLVAQVDDALSMTPESIGLWSQRVNLLLDLADLYQQQLRREYQQMASL
jgi:hypothetical protein